MKELIARKKVLIAVFLVIAVVSGGLTYWWRMESAEKNYRAHIEKAQQYENQGKDEKAIKELEKALKFIAPNDAKKKEEVKNKIAALIKKVEENKKRVNTATDTNGGGGSTGGNKKPGGDDSSTDASSGIPGAQVDVSGVDLIKLLPSSFESLSSSPVGDTNIASVRFDDVDADISYIVYVYRLDSPEKAYNRAKLSVKEVFNKNVSELKLTGDFKGQTGYYGEKDLGQSILTFSYSSILYECLMKSNFLDTPDRKSKLLSLQKSVKKP